MPDKTIAVTLTLKSNTQGVQQAQQAIGGLTQRITQALTPPARPPTTGGRVIIASTGGMVYLINPPHNKRDGNKEQQT